MAVCSVAAFAKKRKAISEEDTLKSYEAEMYSKTPWYSVMNISDMKEQYGTEDEIKAILSLKVGPETAAEFPDIGVLAAKPEYAKFVDTLPDGIIDYVDTHEADYSLRKEVHAVFTEIAKHVIAKMTETPWSDLASMDNGYPGFGLDKKQTVGFVTGLFKGLLRIVDYRMLSFENPREAAFWEEIGKVIKARDDKFDEKYYSSGRNFSAVDDANGSAVEKELKDKIKTICRKYKRKMVEIPKYELPGEAAMYNTSPEVYYFIDLANYAL